MKNEIIKKLKQDKQKLVDLCFQMVLTISDKRWSLKFSKKSIEERAKWVAEQFRGCGFDTEPCGSNWGLLKEDVIAKHFNIENGKQKLVGIHSLLSDHNKILRLQVDKKQFEMIKSGIKKEIYLDVTDYWMKRIAGINGCGTGYNYTLLCNNENKCLSFDAVELRNGSKKICFICDGISVDVGKKKWDAPSYRVFVIKLGKEAT